MTAVHTRHDLASLLASGVDPSVSHDFLALLAAIGAAERADAAVHLGAGRPHAELFAEYIELLAPLVAPSEPRALDGWLIGVETVALADRGAALLGESIDAELREPLRARLARLTEELQHAAWRPWDAPLVAAATRVQLPDTLPWSLIRSRTAAGLLHAGSVDDLAVRSWLHCTLHAEDAATLRRLVRDCASWRSAYVHALDVGELSVHVPRVDPPQTISAAVSSEELDHALCLLRLRLPHLGEDGLLEGRLGDGVIWWRWSGIDRPIVPSTLAASEYAFDDEVLGAVRIPIVSLTTPEIEVAEDVRNSTGRLASGLVHPRARSIAVCVAHDFARGRLRTGLDRAAAAFDLAVDDADEEVRWASVALSTRLALETLAARLDEPDVDSAVDAADRDLQHAGRGLMLIEDAAYDRLVDTAFVDPDRWWGARARADTLVSIAAIDEGLEALRDRRDTSNVVYPPFQLRATPAQDEPTWLAAAHTGGPKSALVALEELDPSDASTVVTAFEHAHAVLLATPSPWLDASLAELVEKVAQRHPENLADIELLRRRVTPRPGAVPLVLIDTRDERGFVVEVRLSRSDSRHARIGPLAWEAMERAFAAVTSCAPARLPRYPPESHAIEFVGLPASAQLDGASLALPIALAIASYWLERPIPRDIAASADLRARGGETVPVDSVAAKAQALARASGGAPVRFLVAELDARALDVGGIAAVAVASLDEALATCELPLGRATYSAEWGDVASRIELLHADVNRVKQQRLEGFLTTDAPWRALGTQMELLLASLKGAQLDATEELAARVHAALAFEHAGELARAYEVLRDFLAFPAIPVELSMLHKIVQLGAAIDTDDPANVEPLASELESMFGQVAAQDRARVGGYVLGALGRAALHCGDAYTAVHRLRDAVAVHQGHRRHEVARSRIYLASAVRVLEGAGAALHELALAESALPATREFSQPYAETTEMFLRYERARARTLLRDFDAAHRDASWALERSRGRGFWPQLGILRVLAWLDRARGDVASASARIERMSRLDVGDHGSLRDRLLAEAEGAPEDATEVY